jgi:hypothetical protein
MKDVPTPESLVAPLKELVDHCVKSDLCMMTTRSEMKRMESQFEIDSERLKQGLLRIRLLPLEERQSRIRDLQQKLCEQMDIIHARVGSEQLELEQDVWRVRTYTLGGQLYDALEGLLFYIEHHCQEEFDYDAPLCKSQREVWAVKMWIQLSIVHTWFADEQFPNVLRYEVMVPYYQVVQPGKQLLLSFREWIYRATLLNELEIVAKLRPDDAEEMLLRVMIRYNFNREQYMDYCMEYFKSELMREDLSDAERAARLQHYRRLISSARPTSSQVALRPQHDALHLRLMSWIDDTQAEPVVMMAPERRKERVPRGDKPHKQRLGLAASGPESAGFTRALAECGFFTEENYAEIVRHFAWGFSTVGTDAPKVKHVREDFDTLTETAYSYIENLCGKMCQLVAELRSGKRELKKSK